MVSITTEAASQLREILERQDKAQIAVRVFVQAAKDNQVAYGMALDDNQLEDDSIIEAEGIRFVVDADSAPFVDGSEIDFVDNLMGRGFTIQNPHFEPLQSTGCGCGAGGCGCGSGNGGGGGCGCH
jgi:iron-sulfur cluster assembly protein